MSKIFGRQKEAWTSLANEIDATYVSGGFWKVSKVVKKVNAWIITLDTFAVHAGKVTVVYTRMRVPFVSRDRFRFKIYRKNFFTSIGKLFGMQDLSVGFPEFDKKFIIQGNDTLKLQKLFSSEVIRKLIESQPKLHLKIKDDEGWPGTKFPPDADELYFHVPGIIHDVGKLKVLFLLFEEVLTKLVEIGAAAERDPGVELK